MKVAILGCGPAGLVAAHAADGMGCDVSIYSKPRKSHMYGAQYLHKQIPNLPEQTPSMIRYELRGSIDDYRQKVYGKTPDSIKVSPEDYEGDHEAFDIRETYDTLWEIYGDRVQEADIKPSWIVGSLPKDFDLTISTIPQPQMCMHNHTFASQKIWAMGDAAGERVTPVRGQIPDNTVICNGQEVPTWYRASNIFGYTTVEWSQNGRKPPLPVSEVQKPLRNNCTCWPDIARLGRYGMWTKGVLVHHAYMMAVDLVIGNLTPDDTREHFEPCPRADASLTHDTAMQMGCRCG